MNRPGLSSTEKEEEKQTDSEWRMGVIDFFSCGGVLKVENAMIGLCGCSTPLPVSPLIHLLQVCLTFADLNQASRRQKGDQKAFANL